MPCKLAAVTFAIGTLVSSPLSAQLHPNIWTVRSGDALSLLAERFDTSVEQLQRWNSLENDQIMIGQKLVVRGEEDEDLQPVPELTIKTEQSPKEVITSKESGVEITLEEVDLGQSDPQELEPNIDLETSDVSDLHPVTEYKVRSGDTLNQIAEAQNTTLRAIVDANPGISPNRIRAGDKIHIGTARPEVAYIVERGDTISSIAERYGISSAELRRWNANIPFSKMRVGTNLRLFTDAEIASSESIGPPNRGKLQGGVQLGPHKGYLIRAKERSWGTAETVRWIEEAFQGVTKKYSSKKRVRVHDISDEDGGSLRDHKSHQSGRDVDISYYQKSCKGGVCPFDRVKPRQLDVARQWALLSHWLKNKQAEVIFIDYSLQAPLYRYAKKKGATKAQLEHWFQYPRGKNQGGGKIRHFRKHDDHLHARFVCPITDEGCR